MTQSTPTIGANQTGLQYRNQDNDGKQALLNHHKGATAPSYAEAGIIWLDDAATPWILKIYDGADWITFASVNATTNVIEAYHGAAGLRLLNHATDTGAANAYAVAPVPAITAYATGQMVTLKPAAANTGASTLNINSLGIKSIKTLGGADLTTGTLATTGVYTLIYDGTNFVLLGASNVNDSDVSFTDITTGNASTTKHGFLKKLDNTATNFMNGAGNWAAVTDAALSISDIATNNASTTAHGFLKKLDNTATNFMNGAGNWAAVTDAALSTSDVTTNNAATTKHGFLKKLSNAATDYMDGTGAWSVPAGAVSLTQLATASPNGVTTQDFTSISPAYRGLLLVWSGISCSAATRKFYVTSNCGAGLGSEQHHSIAVLTAATITPATGAAYMWPFSDHAAADTVNGYLYIHAYANTVGYKAYQCGGNGSVAASVLHGAGTILSTGAVQGLRGYWSGSGNFDAGTITLYGVL